MYRLSELKWSELRERENESEVNISVKHTSSETLLMIEWWWLVSVRLNELVRVLDVSFDAAAAIASSPCFDLAGSHAM